jgi:hypothetical protein
MSFIIDLVRSSNVRAATEMIEISFPIELSKSTSLGHDLFPEDKIEKSHGKTIYSITYGISYNTTLLYCRLLQELLK